MIWNEHCVDVIHYFSHSIKADESRDTQFINGAQKPEALLVFADDSDMGGGWIGILMSFGSIGDIQHRCNDMLASCQSKWGFERKYDIFGWKGEQLLGEKERQMGSAVQRRGVHRRCRRSAEWKEEHQI